MIRRAPKYTRIDTPFPEHDAFPIDPSSLLMNAIPAKVAGVERITMVTPTPGGDINPLVLADAEIAGIEEIWRVGGAQAVAALAYGTERIKPVDVITGPGNEWEAEDKRPHYGVVRIDMVSDREG